MHLHIQKYALIYLSIFFQIWNSDIHWHEFGASFLSGKTELNEALQTLEVETQRLKLQWSKVVAQVTSTWKAGSQP